MKLHRLMIVGLLVSLILAACAPYEIQSPIAPATGIEVVEPSPERQEISESDMATAESEEEAVLPTEEPQSEVKPPPGADRHFLTDFSIHSVPYEEILSGGPPKDGIPSIDRPQFVSIEEADGWIGALEPVIQVAINEEVKAYPIQILTWHEIVNDIVGEVPVVVTFCPLCNTAIAFERTVGDLMLDFGTTGRLRYSNLIMYDRQTETWWQQGNGEAIVGTLTGTQLEFVPAAMISWEMFKDANPDGQVLSRNTGYNRNYGQNPYVGYDNINNSPFLYQGPTIPGQLMPVARILALEFDGETVAYPYEVLSEVRVVNDRVGNQEVAIFWSPETASALDSGFIAEGRDVGSAVAYDRHFNGQLLTFHFGGANFVDNETSTTWDILGRGIAGALHGEQLTEVVSVNHFWFSWAAFKPETRVFQPDLQDQ